MMFIAFLERKGWLNFNGRKDYLKALFADYHVNEDNKRTANFHKSRLNTLFFRGLNNPHGDQLSKDPQYKIFQRLIGDVPYLNGGLFEEENDDVDGPVFPDTIVVKILNDLVYHFNFTVTESTPLDVEVAVDPEMLGRIFEELVTGRHESGSYYTPKPIVAFMCREALKGYLETALPDLSKEVLNLFVNENDAAEINNPEAVLNALRVVKVCDPACGSGAYLLGMLHELLEKRESLFAARKVGTRAIYERKLEIIQNNLYGVDVDDFAVNIARLRLWLSLIVDYEDYPPPPLPNLDFKIETGDSLTAPDPSGGLQPDMFRYQQVQEFLQLKNEFMGIHAGSEKKKQLDKQIKELRNKIEEWAHPKGYDKSSNAFDWQVDFAEVFAPELAQSTLSGKMAGIVNTAGGQMELMDTPKESGFDIVLANPPYVRQEILGGYKDDLKPIYPEVYNGTADLYVYFYARAHQLLRNGGVSCFISSSKWLKAGYGEKLRQHLLDKHAFHLVADFGDLPVFQSAIAYPCIFLWQKSPRGKLPTLWAEIKDLQECYDEGILEHISRIAEKIPSSQFGIGKPRITSQASAKHQATMKENSIPLAEWAKNKIFRGIVTGYNDAFIINKATRDELVENDRKSAEIIKPLIAGDDVKRYEVRFTNSFIIFSRRGIQIEKYPAVQKYLSKYRLDLTPKKKSSEKRGRKVGTYAWYEIQDSTDYYPIFDRTKIVYPEIAKDPRFYLDTNSYYLLKTIFCIDTNDWYLLGVLNSGTAQKWFVENLSILQGGYRLFSKELLQNLPIPDAPQDNRKAVAKLAEQAQNLHTQRRKCIEKFLREIGIEPVESTSRNPLEQPWLLNEEEFTRRTRGQSLKLFKSAQEETMSVAEEILKVEKEIDARVKSLYGVD